MFRTLKVEKLVGVAPLFGSLTTFASVIVVFVAAAIVIVAAHVIEMLPAGTDRPVDGSIRNVGCATVDPLGAGYVVCPKDGLTNRADVSKKEIRVRMANVLRVMSWK